MKDPRHIIRGMGCTRCGLGSRWGKYCPVGFWADKKQHAQLDTRPSDSADGLKVMSELTKKWLLEWEAKQ